MNRAAKWYRIARCHARGFTIKPCSRGRATGRKALADFEKIRPRVLLQESEPVAEIADGECRGFVEPERGRPARLLPFSAGAGVEDAGGTLGVPAVSIMISSGALSSHLIAPFLKLHGAMRFRLVPLPLLTGACQQPIAEVL
jgi:hypothetical protein